MIDGVYVVDVPEGETASMSGTDTSAAAQVRIDLGAVAASCVREILSERDVAVREGGFDWTVPAGGVSVFEITR